MNEGTNGIPKALEDKLIEAKQWSERSPGVDSMHRLKEWQAEGTHILLDVVEAVEETWGFGAGPLPKKEG